MKITKRYATTLFGRFNLSIISVTNFSDPYPVQYTPNDFFVLYDAIFGLNFSVPGSDRNNNHIWLTDLVATGVVEGSEDPLTGTDLLALAWQSVIAGTLLYFNDGEYGNSSDLFDNIPEGLINTGASAALAIPVYRVIYNCYCY